MKHPTQLLNVSLVAKALWKTQNNNAQFAAEQKSPF